MRVYTPRAYQPIITEHILNHDREATWSFMGSGKTVASLTAFDILRILEPDQLPVLVVAPKRPAIMTWPDEQKEWEHLQDLRLMPIVGNVQSRLVAVRRAVRRLDHVYTVNYEQLPWLVGILGAHWPFRRVMCDESTRLKSFRLRKSTIRAKSLALVAWTKVHAFDELTGTPSPNGLLDLWGQMYFIDKGERLGSTFTKFKQNFFMESFDGGPPQPFSWASDQIADRLSDVCASIHSEDYFDLEKPIERTIDVTLGPKARRVYDEFERELFAEIEPGVQVEVFNKNARNLKCLQMASGAFYTDKQKNWLALDDGKIEALREIVGETNGEPILVGYHWKFDAERILKAFPRARVFDTEKDKDDWNAGRIPMMLIHPASGGHGLNLQYGGRIGVFFSHWWDMELYTQLVERIGPVRQFQAGFDRNVFLYFIRALDTLDQEVIERRSDKITVDQALRRAVQRRGKKV